MLWFCWICRKPMTIVHGRRPDSTQYQVEGKWRDCHDECYDTYSEGLDRKPVVPDTWEALAGGEGECPRCAVRPLWPIANGLRCDACGWEGKTALAGGEPPKYTSEAPSEDNKGD